MGGALLAALAAIVLAAYAAEGVPRDVERDTSGYIQARYRSEARTVARQLRWSRRAAILAAVLLAGAIGMNLVWDTSRAARHCKVSSDITIHEQIGRSEELRQMERLGRRAAFAFSATNKVGSLRSATSASEATVPFGRPESRNRTE